MRRKKIKEILCSLDDFCALTGEQIGLAEFIKQKYNTTLAAALRLCFQHRSAAAGFL